MAQYGTPLAFLKAHGVPIPPGMSNTEISALASKHIQAVASQPANKQQLNVYKQNLAVQQSQQGLAARNSLGGASPANQHAQIPFNPSMPAPREAARAPTEEEMTNLEGMAKDLGGALQHPPSGSHSLQDYQSQLMVLEHQNKKRLQHARADVGDRTDEHGSGPTMNGQFQRTPGQAFQPGHGPMQGANMSPSHSRAGPSPQISNLEVSQQRKPGQRAGSGAASPEPDSLSQIRGPSPAFAGQPGAVTAEQFQQITQMSGYPHSMLMQNGQQQFVGRPMPGMPFNQSQNAVNMEMMKRLQQGQPGQPVQPGQQFPPGWQQQLMTQPINPVLSDCNKLLTS
jgi:hypothetical protein